MNKGFIQIPLLIAIISSIILGSVVITGGVLVKQGKLKLTANVSDSIRQSPSPTPEFTIEPTAEPTESPEVTKKPVIKNEPVKPIIQISTPTPIIISTPQPTQQQDNAALKIARCQAKRDADYSYFVSKADQQIVEAVQKIKDEAKIFIDRQLKNYNGCLIERPDELKQYDSTTDPYDLCSFYLENAEEKKSYTEKLVLQTKSGVTQFYSQAKSIVDNQYNQCVNK